MFTHEQDLKLYLLAHGIEITAGAEQAWLSRFGGPLTLAEYASTSGICMHAGDTWINAPFIEEFATHSTARLIHDQDEFFVEFRGERTLVEVIPVPRYHERMWTDAGDGREYRYTNLGVTHTDRVRLSPVEGCAWRCTFCDLPYEFKYRHKPPDELVKVIELAVEDNPPARHVLISGGTPYEGEAEQWLDGVYERVARESPIPVDVMMPARKDLEYPAWLRSVGVNMVSINLEISDPQRALKITPNKARALGRDYYLEYIAKAVEAFGVGFVQSLMVFGSAIEPLESTLEGVRDLAERGCLPVLSPFRPDPTTPLGKRGAAQASEDEMKRAWDATLAICDQVGGGVKPGPRCIPCHHNTVTFPDGSDFYVDLDGDLTAR